MCLTSKKIENMYLSWPRLQDTKSYFFVILMELTILCLLGCIKL